MTLVEIEQRRSKHQRKHQKQAKSKQQKVRRPVGIEHHPGPPLNDDQVLTFAEWVRLNSLSPRNGRRIIASGEGPRVVQLSARRIGVTIRANREWQASRERA